MADRVASGRACPRIDNYSTVAESAVNSDAVVGELSTALFDSVGRARKVIMWRTAKSIIAFPASPFLEADSLEGIRDAIQNADVVNCNPELLFSFHYTDTYREFLADCGL